MINVKTRLTYADYLKTPDDERYELLNGELVMAAAPLLYHQYILRKLLNKMSDYIDERNLGELYSSPADVILSDTDVVQPDLLFVSSHRSHILTRENVRGGARPGGRDTLSCHSRARPDDQARPVRAAWGERSTGLWTPTPGRSRILVRRESRFEVAGIYREGQTLLFTDVGGVHY